MVAHRLTAGAAIGAALLAFAGPGLYRAAADIAIERHVATLMRPGGGITVGRVLSRVAQGTVELRDVALAGPGWRVSIAALRLPSPAPALPSLVSSAWARAGNITLDGLTVTIGKAQVLVPHLDVRGTDLDAAALKRLVDPADPATVEDRLARFTMASATAAEVLIGDAGSDVANASHLTLHEVTLTDVAQGRVGALAVGRTDMSLRESTQANKTPLEVGRLDIAALDLPLAFRIALGSRVEAMPSLLPVFRSLGLHGLVIHGDNGVTVTLGDVLSGALRGRPLLLQPSDIVALADKPDLDRTIDEREALADTAVDGLQSLSLDHVEVGGVEVAGKPNDPTSFHMRHMAMDDVAPLKLGALTIDDVGLGAQGVDMTLGHLVVEGSDATPFLPAFRQALMGVKAPKFAADFEQIMMKRSSLALSDLRIVLPESSGGMGPLRKGTNAIEIPVASATGQSDPDGTARSGAFVHMRYDFGADPRFKSLVAMGIGRMDASADYDISYNLKSQQFAIDRFVVDALDLGKVAMSVRLGGVAADVAQSGTPEAAKAAENVVFQGFTLDLANAGLVEKVLPSLAASANVSVPLFKAQMKTQAELSLTQALGPGPTTQKLLAAVSTFIDDPKTFNLSVTAPAGLKVATVSAASDAKALLGSLVIDARADR